ncbi:uncharacterized protein [Equus przewalskii]|uniref:Uncharacterized protein isoform X2 n=1 Tax=Equus przewalskii TaxID=9798 RepID=A0ABM4N8D2_EQUPR
MVGLGEESGEGTVVRFGYQLPIRKQAGFWPKERGGGKCPGNLQAHVKARATCKPRKRSECKRPPRQVLYCSCHTTATPSTILIQKMVGNRECWGGGRDPCVGASFLLRRMWACRVEGYEREMSFRGIFMSPDQCSRLWQPDGCWSSWILAGMSLQQAPDPPRLMAGLSLTYLPGGQGLSPSQV